ncbi:MAG: DUF3795 domain-containing protein [Clostridia bacterium]|nr:DUF3795 domain-containing protein [Clostridia bacterium]
MDKELLGKCGYYCGQCPSYLADKCKGCIKENVGGECYAHDCAINKGLISCGHCEDFPCRTLQDDPKASLLSPLWLKWKRTQKDDIIE